MITLVEALKLANDDNLKKSIGEQSEHTLHRTIKFYIEPNEDYHEKNVNNKIVDIIKDNNIYEIQTKSFKNLIDKLDVLLPEYKVTIIYPYIIRKRLIKINKNGEVLETRLSPKKSKAIHSLLELFYLKDYLLNPNLTIKLLLINADEVRVEANNRSGKVRLDVIPTEIIDEITLYNKEDYINLLPTLNNEFTQKEFSKAVGIKQLKAIYILYTYLSLGIIVKDRKESRSIIYKKEIE